MNVEKAHVIYGKMRVLCINNDISQQNLVKDISYKNNDIIIEPEKDLIDSLNKIKESYYDCILVKHSNSFFNEKEILNDIRTITDIPIILYNVNNINYAYDDVFYTGMDINEDYGYELLEDIIVKVTKNYRNRKILKEVLNKIEESIVLINDKYEIIYYTESFSDMINDKNLYKKSIYSFIEKNHKRNFKKFINSNEINTQTYFYSKNGTSHFVELNKLKLDNMVNDYQILKIKDISGTLKENAINENEGVFYTLANISPDAIMVGSIFGYISYINPAYTKLTGYTWDEIVGSHLLQLQVMKGRDIRPYWDLLKHIITGNKGVATSEFTYTRKDGTSGVGDFFAGIAKVGKKRQLVGIVRDITERRLKEEEYQNIFRNSPEGIIHLDMEGEIKSINESAVSILNIDPQLFLGESIFSVENMVIEPKVDFHNMYEKIISGNKIDPLEIKIIDEDDIKWLQINISLIRVLDEKLGIIISIRDITHQKRIEEEKEIYTNKLEKLVQERTNQLLDNEKMVTMAKVSSMIAHDLKGPLQVISNSLHLIKYKPDQQEQYLEYISDAVKQANSLIEEMRSQSRETPIILEPVSLNDIIQESLIQVKVSENVVVDVSVRLDKNIMLDRSKFIRVFNNLIKNSIEAMPDGGKISIIIEEEMNNVSIKIIDTGSGIPSEQLSNLFRPFQTTKDKGMGLGLVFCKNTVEAHGGKILVESEVGKGTMFNILIPDNIRNSDIKIDIK